MIPVEPTPDHPLPFDMADEQPLTHKDAVAVAVNTAGLIAELGGSLDYDNKSLQKAADLIAGTDKPDVPKHVAVPAEAAAAHALVRQFDFQAFADVMQARNFITNKLVKIADCGDPKLELKALELLGKHSDIGLFTERSEITVHHTSSKALEESIKDRIKRLLNSDVVDITPNLMDELDGIEVKKQTESKEAPVEDEKSE